MPSATIKVFLAHGDAKRLRTAEISNWTGKALSGPRTEFDQVLARDEAEKSGVYFLTGVAPETGRAVIYVGEAESIRDRIRAHLEKDYWNQISFVVSKDENLTKAHIKYLEGRLIAQARESKRAEVKNGQGSGARLPESDREDMEIFLDRIHQLLPILGIDAFVPQIASAETKTERELLICEIKGIHATAYLTPTGILVQKGSEAVLSERASAAQYPWVLNSRQRLREEGALAPEGARLVFTRDVEFSSPSAAAAVIHGGTANGLTAWKSRAGVTLKDLELV